MENFIFRQKRKMDEESHKQKIKQLQDKYIPFLRQLIIKLNDANTGKSRQAQLEKMKSLLSLLRDRPRTLTPDVLTKTENVLETLYKKLGSGNTPDNMRAIEDKPRDDPQNSKTLALRPNMDVQLRGPGAMNLDVVKQKLLHVNEAPKLLDPAIPGKQGIDELVLKQKANAIIGDKGRPIDSRVEQHAVTSEIRLSVNRISTVISSRTDRTIMNTLPEPIPRQGCPIPLGNFQSSQSVDLYCRRTQDRTIYERRFSQSQAHSSNNVHIHTTPKPALPAPPIRPEITANDSDIIILNSPPLSSDDIQSLMMETTSSEKTLHENSSKISHTGETRLAHKYNPHPRNERPSSHLPIDATGHITVSLDDPRLKKPISQKNDPRLDPRVKRVEHSQNMVSKYNNRGMIETSNRMAIEGANRKAIEGPNRMAIEGPNRKGIEGPNWMASESQGNKAIEGPNRKAIEGPPIRKAIEGPQIRKAIEILPIRKVADGPPNQKQIEGSSRKAIERRKSIECRKPVEIKPAQYEVNNPAPPKKTFNPMERRSELDDDYMDVVNTSGMSKFHNLKSIESVPREKHTGDPSVPVMKSQFDKMYRKNDFSQDYNKHVKNINQGIKDFKIPKKSLSKAEKDGESKNKLADKVKDDQIGKSKDNKQEKSGEKKVKVKNTDKQKLSVDKSTAKHQRAKFPEESNKKTTSETSSDSELTEHDEVIYKTAKKRIKIIDSDSESGNSDLDSVALLSRKSTTQKHKKQDRSTQAKEDDKPKAKKKIADKRVRAVSGARSDEDISNTANLSKDSTPEPVSSTGQLDSEPSGKCYSNDTHHSSNADVDGTKDSITKEWLEGVLTNMISPNILTKDKLLDMMKNVMDEKKFERVKYIMENDDVEAEDKDGSLRDHRSEDKSDTVNEVAAASCSRILHQKKAPKKKNTELDKLNEDIRTMFISEEVLTATGRRMCTELRKKDVQYTENTPPESPKPEKYHEEVDSTSPLPGPSKRGRKRKVSDAAQETSLEKTSGATNDVSKQININRMLKVELQKLKDSEIPQKVSEKKAIKKSKKEDDDLVSNSPTPKKKMRRRNNIWFRNPPKKKKNQRSSSIGTDNEQSQSALAEPPIKRRPGPKSKTQILPGQNMPASASLDVGAIKKEQMKQSYAIKNIDPTCTAINNKTCKVCAYSGKQIVTHYVKEHHEVFCSRLPRNISEFLKSHEKGMLFAESYNMKLQYTGSKVFGHCIFCREEMYEQPNRWLTHFTKHTGEFEYVCSCGVKAWSPKLIRIHVKKCEERGSYEFKALKLFDELYIKAYMCGDCNFVQLLPENVQNHIKKEHATYPRIHQVILLNYGDESVKEHHQTFLDMYKHNITSLDVNQEEGVFKSTDEKTNEAVTSKSLLEDISKTIPNETTSDIADKLHDRFGEKSAINLKKDHVVVKTETPVSEEEFDTKESSNTINVLAADSENPIEYDDDEWEDIESDSDESVMSQSSRTGQNKKLARLAQKIGARSSMKRKSDSNELSSPKRSRVEITPAGLNQNKPPSSVICKTETCEVYKVENFQYQIVDGEAQYYCLMTKCLFISSVVELFIDHLMKVHDDDTWSGYCELCKENKFPVSRLMITEFHHLVSDHPWKKVVEDPPASPITPPVAPEVDTKEDTKPAIRLRRLSGDKLSAQMEDSFKIPTTPTNVRSLTVRRVSKSPDLSSSPSNASTASVSPMSSVHTSLSPMQTTPPRSIIITKTNSLESPNVPTTFTSQANITPTSLAISTVSPIQSLKTFTFTLPTTKSANTYGNIVPVANTIQLPAKIAIRRSTISTDVLPGIVPRMDHGNELMPWIKKPGTKIPYAVKKMLEKEVICAPFKCMGTECWYFTMNEMDMVAHLKNHDQIIEDQAEKTTITDTSSWLECSYCTYMADSRNDLMAHLKMDHLHCEYLCPKCFYRAINADYVARHLQEYHKSNINVWHLMSDFKNTIPENAVARVKDNVKLLTCKTCDIKFLNSLHFSEHILSHANRTFECGFCSTMIPFDMMKKHMFCHSVADFECIYCEFATSNKNTLSKHMCDRHPNRKLIFYNREEPQEHLEKFKLSQFEDFCQFRVTVEKILKESLSQSNPRVACGTSILKSNLFATPTICPPVVAPNQGPLPFVISNVVSLHHGQPQASSLMIKDVCTLAKDTAISSPSNSTALNQSPFGTKKVQATLPTQGNAIVLEGVSVSKEEFEKQSFGFSTALTKAIVDWVGKTGISQKELLKCSESECSFQGKFKGDFMEHIDRSHSNALLKCPQCVNVFWHSSASLWNHLETHGQKRYFCIMCDFTAKTEPQMVVHCTDTVHKWLAYSVVPITNATVNGIYVLCPRNTSSLKIEQFKADFVRNIQQLSPQSRATAETSKDKSNKDSYGPDEIDKLPSKPVVKNVYCKLCGYKTMIVKNLIRHFDAHRQTVYVPNLDPVNPVPCLSSNEKNFDKMTNLACSSNMDSRSKTLSEPVYIVQQKRFVCGVSYCSYITIDDTMLKYHLSTLHANEKFYKCPHCHVELLKGEFSVDTIIMHYRLHGEKLFMCDKCQYMSDTTQNVEKHIKNTHVGAANIYILRDESRSEASAAPEPPLPAVRTTTVQDDVQQKKWICNDCNHTTYIKTDMATHALEVHNTKYQYQCGYCSFNHLTRSYIIEHIKQRHGDKVIIREAYAAIKPGAKMTKTVEDSVHFWRRDSTGAKSIRGIPCESSEILPRTNEEDEEDYLSEDDYPDHMTNLPVAVDRTVSKKQNVDDFAAPVKHHRIERIIQCNLCEKTTKSALTMQVVHFPECHPGVPVSTKIIEQISTLESNALPVVEEETKIPTGYKLICFHCQTSCDDGLNQFKKHYVDQHTEQSSIDIPPCLFSFVKLMYCGLCQQVRSSYDDIGKHLKTVHKTESVIVKSSTENVICGACDYDAGDEQNLLRHAKLRHTNKKFKPLISQATLDDMLNIRAYPMKRCTACKELVCDIDGRQSEEHLRTKHSASVMATFVNIRNPSYICGRCHIMSDSDTTAFTHILTHTKSFKCSVCANFFAKYEEALEHMKALHSGDGNVIQFAWPLDAIFESLMVFPNGLVMSLEELQMTKYRFDQSKFKMLRNVVVRKHMMTSSDLLL